MTSLERLLKQDEIISKISSSLNNSGAKVVVVEGPSGCGKSWVSLSAAKNNPKQFGETLLAEGDLVRIDEQLSPFERLTRHQSRFENIAINGTKVAITIGGTYLGAGGLGAKVFDWVRKIKTEFSAHKKNQFSDDEWRLIGKIKRLSKGSPALILADNIHWWDEVSLRFLRKLIENIEVLDRDLNLKVSIIAIRTKDNSQHDYNKNYIDKIIKDFQVNVVSMYACDLYQFSRVIKFFGAPDDIPNEINEKLFRLTTGNLKLAQLIAGAIGSGLKIDFESEEIDLGYLIQQVLIERFMISDLVVDSIFSTLKSASLIGMYFEPIESNCLSPKEDKNDSLKDNLKKAENVGLLEVSKERIAFTHPIIWSFFKKELSENEIKTTSLRLAKCLEVLRPGSYSRRATLLKAADMNDEALEATALEYLRIVRSGETPSDLLSTDDLWSLQMSPLWSFCYKLHNGYKLASKGRFDLALDLAIQCPQPIQLGLAMELNYLVGLCKVEGGNRELAHGVAKDIDIHLSVIEEDIFGEIVTRLRLLQQQALVLSGSIEEARQNSIILMEQLRIRAKFDNDSEKKFHQVLRKSNSVHDPFVAKSHAMQAVNFFSLGLELGIPRDPLELYRSLINLSGIEIQLGNWNEACSRVDDAIDLVERLNSFDFPRIDVALNNLNVARLRGKLDSLSVSISQQEHLIRLLDRDADNFQHKSNLIGMLILNGNYEKAKEIIANLEEKRSKKRLDEPYIWFHLKDRKMIIWYLEENWSAAQSAHEEMMSFLKNSSWPAKNALTLRQANFAELISSKQTLTPRELDHYFINKDTNGAGSSWPHFGRGVLFSELQFWSDS